MAFWRCPSTESVDRARPAAHAPGSQNGSVNFDDLPIVRDEDDARRVHNETATYFLSTTNVAHAEMTCRLADD